MKTPLNDLEVRYTFLSVITSDLMVNIKTYMNTTAKDQQRANSQSVEKHNKLPCSPAFLRTCCFFILYWAAGLCDTSSQVIPLSLQRRLFRALCFGEESSGSRHVCQNTSLSGFHEVLRDRERREKGREILC